MYLLRWMPINYPMVSVHPFLVVKGINYMWTLQNTNLDILITYVILTPRGKTKGISYHKSG